MKADTRSLLNDYVNGISDLQIKHKKDNEKFVLLALLFVYVVEYMTAPTQAIIKKYAPILLENNLEDSKDFLKKFDKGLNGKGEFEGQVIRFKNDNISILNYITKTRNIPHKSPFLAITKKQRLAKLEEEATLMEQTNDISYMVNTMFLNKRIKIWNTQNDERVRRTTFHTSVSNMIVPINDTFNVGSDSALFPSHSTLPAHERYNCRCYLTYK